MIEIKDTSGKVRFATEINTGSKRRFQLMKEDYITLNFSLDNPIYFKLGDGIDNELGIYELIDPYKPVYNQSTSGYDYGLRLDAYYWKWKNKKFFYTPESMGKEASWSLTSTLQTHADAFLANITALGYTYRGEPFEIRIDKDAVEDIAKSVTYNNINLIDALSLMAQTWGCEWWVTDKCIHFGRCEFDTNINFEFGENVAEMIRKDGQMDHATRIYAFGSEKNIPVTYRKNLVFGVTNVSGGEISDSTKVVSADMFLDHLILENNPPPVKLNYIITEWYYDGFANKSFSMPIDDLIAGNYVVDMSGLEIISWMSLGNRLAGNFSAEIKLDYSVGTISKRLLLGNFEINANEKAILSSRFENMFFELASAATKCSLLINASVGFTGKDNRASIGFHFEGKLTLKLSGKSAHTSVTFLSGVNKGKTYDAIFNPRFLDDKDSNVIRLPNGISASVGDRYTIDGIIKSKVPDNYFSDSDNNEFTIEGIASNRLMLPVDTPYIDAYENLPPDEIVEQIVVFDDIYPHGLYTVYTVTEEADKEDDKTDGPIYLINDKELTKFHGNYKTGDLHVVFQKGKLRGMDFTVDWISTNKSSGTLFRIKPNDMGGRMIPDKMLRPYGEKEKPGDADTYILYGFDVELADTKMIPEAEQKLKEKAIKYAEKLKIDPSTYDCQMTPEYIYNNGEQMVFEIGDKVNLINPAYFEKGRQSRIIGYEYPLDIPYDHPVYTVGETAAYSRIGALEEKVDSLTLTYQGQSYAGVGGNASSGGSGVYLIGLHDPTNPSSRNTFSALRTLDELKERALSRLESDSAEGFISFLSGLRSEERALFLKSIDVIDGIFTDTLEATEVTSQLLNVVDKLVADKAVFKDGISSYDFAEKLLGWMVQSSGDAEFKSVRIRNFLETDEFRYNHVAVVSGEEWNAPGGGIVESIDVANQIITLKQEPGEVLPVEIDDICKGIFNDDTGFKTCFFRITEKIGDNQLKYILKSGTTFHPKKAMHFVAYGNFTNTERQKSNYSTQSYVRYLTGVKDWEITKNMIAMQLGDLSNLRLFGLDMTGHSAYLRNIYMTGVIKQLSDDGLTESRVPCFKGAWVEDTYYYYDEVTHGGSTWLCISETPTTETPKEGATDWLEKSAKGKDPAIINIISSNGTIFQNGAGDTTLTAYVIKGDMDITDSISKECFSWERRSRNNDADEVFNHLHIEFGHVLQLTSEDIEGHSTFDCLVSF